MKDLLKSVSRSFYLSLRVLPHPLQPVMGVGYLLCRAADTIADAATTTLEERLKLLRQFEDLFLSFPITADRLKDFIRDLEYANAAPKSEEGKLLKNFGACATAFNELSRTDQALVQQVVLSVIKGMITDLQTFGDSAETLRALKTEKDLEDYIQWIGGEPGRFWTGVCLAHLPQLRITNRDQWLKDGIAFGRGLQMVNILRDLPADLKMGRCYLPLDLLAKRGLTPENLLAAEKEEEFRVLYAELIEQTRERLECGRAYLNALPATALRLRAAAGWPMLIGFKTLDRLLETPSVLTAKGPVKIKRWEIYRLLLGSAVTLSPICTARQSRRAAIHN